jgi:prolyl oligopeptidase
MSVRPFFRRSLLLACAVPLLGAAAIDPAPVRPVTDIYYGTSVVDPYRYMESDDPAFTAWKDQQLAATRSMLANAREVTHFAAVATAAAPRLDFLTLANGRVFYVRSGGGRSEVVERDRSGGPEHVVVPATAFDEAGGKAALGAIALSSDATLLAVHVSIGNSLTSDIHIVRTADGTEVEPALRDTIFDYLGFMPDGKGLLYAKAAKSSPSISVPDLSADYLHRIGTAQSADIAVFGTGISKLVDVPPHAFAFVDPSGAHALAEVRDVAAGGSQFFAAPLAALGTPGTPWRALGYPADAFTDYAVRGAAIDLTSSADAPNFKVLRASLDGPLEPHVVLPPSDTVVVSGTLDGIPKAGIFALYAAADADYVQLLDGGVNRMVRIPWVDKPAPQPVTLPLSGSVLQVATDPRAEGALVELTSWTNPGDVYSLDPARGNATALGVRRAGEDPKRVAEELTAFAADGTKVGVSVVHRPGLRLDGSHPLILRVAGAYGFSFTPDYRQVPERWLESGGVYAIAHVRGGGERGESWHRAGMGARKSTTWNDLIAASLRLIDAGYTSPAKLDLYGTMQSYLGGVASSIAIGRAIEERPDLFAAAIVDAPVFDMIRSERTGLGRQSISEFGTVAVREDFTALQAMSPYEHVRAHVAYPPLLVRSLAPRGYGDDWQAAKMVARLQAAEGRYDRAYLDVVGATAADARRRGELDADAFAFFLYEDGVR